MFYIGAFGHLHKSFCGRHFDIFILWYSLNAEVFHLAVSLQNTNVFIRITFTFM